MKQKYNAKFFRENLPEWKRKKDPILVRYFYRPLSFSCAAFFANIGLTANDVTIISIFIGLIADALLFIAETNRALGVLASILISVWLLLDCTDGNMARCIKKQPYGEFLDALGSYILVAFLGVGLGVYIFFNGGIFLKSGNVSAILVGLGSSVFDLLMRLTHQKFVVTELIFNKEKNKDDFDESKTKSFFSTIKDKIKLEFGIGGILTPIIFICAITNTLDLIALYLLLYNGLSCITIIILYILKVMKLRNESL